MESKYLDLFETFSAVTKTVLSPRTSIPSNLVEAEFRGIVGQYLQPQRKFFNLQWLEYGLARINEYCGYINRGTSQTKFTQIDELRMAWFLHRYRPTATASCVEARVILTRIETGADKVKVITDLIQTTAGHSRYTNPAHALMQDVSIAYLGEGSRVFSEFEGRLKIERSFGDERRCAIERRNELRELLRNATIYQTPFFQHTRETQAMDNIHTSIKELAQIIEG
ncbi:MAG TPA: hypothetical protein PLV72_03815 [Candidatus Magasanikbacteria bacterium]|nr:hypothetical protein [Candidatus Magasanikbacteria bacterium]